MKFQRLFPVVMIGAMTALAGMAQAQAPAAAGAELCPRTRAEVRDECITFMKAHKWDEASGNWVAAGKPAAKLPEGVTPREKIRAERDAFLKANKWNEAKNMWEPVAGTPRDIATISRADMKKETAAFMRTHRWDEGKGAYVPSKG